MSSGQVHSEMRFFPRGMFTLRRGFALLFIGFGAIIFYLLAFDLSDDMWDKEPDTWPPIPWSSDQFPQSSLPEKVDMKSYALALSRVASVDNWVLLAMADESFMDMTMNFYLSSVQPLKIKNYLIMAIDKVTCGMLQKHNINCFVYTIDSTDTSKAARFDSKEFIQKMNLRSFMILDALMLGYNVLHSDIDMYFFKDPFLDTQCNSPLCDMTTLWDESVSNAGFLFIRNSRTGRTVYRRMISDTKNNPSLNDQNAMQSAINYVKRRYGGKILTLSQNSYRNGIKYWENDSREFGKSPPCSDCVVVHNNWIVTMEAKRYRFRESQMWLYESLGYYSEPRRKYVTYSNPRIFQNQDETAHMEWQALKNGLAIAEILNRTLILPDFKCVNSFNSSCCLLHRLYVNPFEKTFPNYREHVFLSHDLVPVSVKENLSPTYIFMHEPDETLHGPVQTKAPDSIVLTPDDIKNGANSKEVYDWLADSPFSVLRFDSLYYGFSKFMNNKHQVEFDKKISTAFHKGNYRQLFGDKFMK